MSNCERLMRAACQRVFFFLWIKMPLFWGRDLKIKLTPVILNIISLKFNPCLSNYMTCCHNHKQEIQRLRQTNKLSAVSVVEQQCRGLPLNIIFLDAPHKESSVDTGSLVWNCRMFIPLWDGVQIQMAIQMGQSKWMAQSFVGCSPLMHSLLAFYSALKSL